MEPTDNRYLLTYLKAKVKGQKSLINVLRNEIQEERYNNLRMRLDLQVMAENPNSKAAAVIRHRYNIRKAILNESMELKN